MRALVVTVLSLLRVLLLISITYLEGEGVKYSSRRQFSLGGKATELQPFLVRHYW